MANETYLNNVDTEKLEKLMNETTENSKYFESTVDKVVKEYSGDLDSLMSDLYTALTQEDEATTTCIERYYAELTNMVYFMSDRLEKLNVYSDMSKSAYKEVHNKAFLKSATEKDEKGKSLRTVAENTAIAENSAQYESIVSIIYEHAYKTLKIKIDCAMEMITTLKNILKHRISEEYMSNSNSTNISEVV